MKYPKHKTYESLYAKYLDQESLKILMDLLGEDLSNKTMIDICCGNGICTTEAIIRNIKFVHMADRASNMIPLHFYKDKFKIKVSNSNIEDLIPYLNKLNMEYKYDYAVCRQAINYWFNEDTISHLSKILSNRGVFVFNTFNTCPSMEPKIKQYYHKNISFTEISYLTTNNKIYHVQIRQGYPPHMTSFRWVSPEEFNTILKPYFDIERITRNKTDYYKCVKK